MRLLINKAILKILVLGFLGLALGTTSFAQVEDWDFAARRLEGSWITQVTQRDCATGAALSPAFNGLITFSRGGTLVESTTNPAFFPAVRGNGHGVWRRGKDHTFDAVFVAHITMNGALAKTQTIRMIIVLGDDANTFSVTGPTPALTIVPADGGPTIHGCATATATRIKIE